MTSIQHIEENLNRAYVSAIVAEAGMSISLTERSQDYKVDGTIHQISYIEGKMYESGFNLDFQLKATKNAVIDNEVVKYDLDVNTYNFLVERSKNTKTTPIILIVFCLPEDSTKWLTQTAESLILRKCCYLKKIDGKKSDNKSTQRIEIPIANMFTSNTLKMIFNKLENGEWNDG